LFEEIDVMGAGSMLDGVIKGIEDGWFQSQIADSAYEFERRINAGVRHTVGVNIFDEPQSEGAVDVLYIGPEAETEQLRRLADVKVKRDSARVDVALAAVRQTAQDSNANLMPSLLEAVQAYATEGEIIEALADVFGRWVERPSI
jgi:methylmalonyl-CoA mutase N-terminal domain/subunit